jgi:IS30 family transposase
MVDATDCSEPRTLAVDGQSRDQAKRGCSAYRASWPDRSAWERSLRPKPCRLARHAELRWQIAQKLALQWSPKQISSWLKRQFPADPGMQVSHETIYRSLFIQTLGHARQKA